MEAEAELAAGRIARAANHPDLQLRANELAQPAGGRTRPTAGSGRRSATGIASNSHARPVQHDLILDEPYPTP
jgi:hypothetical protein